MRGVNSNNIASMNKIQRNPLKGKIVMISGGEWKGYRGRVINADDNQVIVEIASTCQHKAIDKELVFEEGSKLEKREQAEDNWNYTEGMKTPNIQQTPNYYPSGSQWGGMSPN